MIVGMMDVKNIDLNAIPFGPRQLTLRWLNFPGKGNEADSAIGSLIGNKALVPWTTSVSTIGTISEGQVLQQLGANLQPLPKTEFLLARGAIVDPVGRDMIEMTKGNTLSLVGGEKLALAWGKI